MVPLPDDMRTLSKYPAMSAPKPPPTATLASVAGYRLRSSSFSVVGVAAAKKAREPSVLETIWLMRAATETKPMIKTAMATMVSMSVKPRWRRRLWRDRDIESPIAGHQNGGGLDAVGQGDGGRDGSNGAPRTERQGCRRRERDLLVADGNWGGGNRDETWSATQCRGDGCGLSRYLVREGRSVEHHLGRATLKDGLVSRGLKGSGDRGNGRAEFEIIYGGHDGWDGHRAQDETDGHNHDQFQKSETLRATPLLRWAPSSGAPLI